ncbi:conserved hypothetical protein with DUF2235 domain [Prevotella intermedia]|uniref:T6SS Phospholipase effector Tle1-like catalytic domain-containing protein n=1 Tax=Prevotella intermedia TaxID=28131 RepID=A0A0T7ANH9_PREIN|nr:DUF2235 domain-containing protein [Prevotella intermedia]BAU18564.1 conserved hypothetical protein with DUF2235 domain [Prevotella intermedia]
MKGQYTNSICGVGLPSTQSNKKPNEYIDITIGVFFDGTGNNKYNIEYNKSAKYADKKGVYNEKTRKKEDGYDSYNQGFTNVVNLWNMYKADGKIYIEGPGTAPPKEKNQANSSDKWTSSGKKDSAFWGSALGTGDYGVNEKVKRADKLIIEIIRTILDNCGSVLVRSITFDVFGFSRGATANRYFVRKVLFNPDFNINSFLQKVLKVENISEKISIRFMGLFDTVSSHGLDQIIHDKSKHPNLMIPYKVKTVVHLVAANEYRRFFPLTTVSSAHGLDKSCMEYVLPGAHSDIGGGYNDIEVEFLYMKEDYPPKEFLEKGNRNRKFRGYMSLETLRDKEWISKEDFSKALRKYQERTYRNIDSRTKKRKGVAPYRGIYNTYARIPLQIMYQVAESKGIAFKKGTIWSYGIIAIPNCYPNLIKVAKYLKGEFFARRDIYTIRLGNTKDKNGKIIPMGFHFERGKDVDKLLKSIRREFLHLSAYNQTGFGATSNNRRGIIEG